jgi:hypothetical protein
VIIYKVRPMIRSLLASFVAILLLCSQLAYAAPELAPNHPDRYTVVKGDTLWDISKRFLKNPWFWPEIWQVNPQIKNPHLIYPGDVLGLVYVEGKPKLTMIQRGPDSEVLKLSPKARITPLDTAIPTIPLSAISSFLTRNRVVAPAELKSAPYVLVGQDDRLVTGAGDVIYGRGDPKGADKMGIYREGGRYVDPETGEFLGLEAKSIATARITAVKGQVITMNVIRSSSEIQQGDRLLPTDDSVINSTYTPSAPDKPIGGRMIAVDSGVSQIGQYNVVVINKGRREGLKEGNVLAIYKDGGLVRDPYTKEKVALPAEKAGLLMIFRVYKKLSYGLILNAQRPLAIMDKVKNP